MTFFVVVIKENGAEK